MTQKELSYVEDAIGHESTILSILKNTKESLQDEELISFIEKQEENHTSMKERLMNLLEEKANE